MPSQPDYEAAHRLNPDKFPMQPVAQLQESDAMMNYLADELAKAQGRTKKEVLADARVATSGGKSAGKKAALPEREEKVTEKGAAQAVDKARAEFFAHKERSTYQPMSEYPEGDVDEPQIAFFQTADEAEANGYVKAEADTGDKVETVDDPPKPSKVPKKGKK